MASVAIIHAVEDALPARALAEKLRQAKLTVILEKTGDELRNAVKDAKVTVALWSPRSTGQQQLVEDVNFAKGKSKVIHALMQNAPAPDAFRGEKSVVNLTGWRGEDDFPAWRELAKLVTDRAGVAAIPPPAPKPPSGFFQPGAVREAQPAGAGAAQARGAPQRQAAPAPRPQPAAPPRPAAAPPRAPAPRVAEPAREKSGGGGRMVMIAIVTFIVVALVGGGGYYFWNQSQNADATATAWQAVDQNSADALRAFLDGDPGDYRDDAQQALAALEERTFEAASDTDTIEALEAFVNDFPESEHAVAARGRIAELQLEQPAAPVDPNATVDPNAPGATPDPDLVPPGSTATPAPAPTTDGPAPITPPATEPTTPPGDAPVN
ncbi:MAG TPA: hypothetical protein VFO00_08125 [Vitreimonas sp.]|nr:hypothetical protein [Vitreimonas sp.]